MEVSRSASIPVEDAHSMMDSLSCPRYLESLEPRVRRSMAIAFHDMPDAGHGMVRRPICLQAYPTYSAERPFLADRRRSLCSPRRALATAQRLRTECGLA